LSDSGKDDGGGVLGWRMPQDFVQLPAGYPKDPAGPRIDMRSQGHTRLLTAAARHNAAHLPEGARDPGAAVRDAEARARLRPGAAPAVVGTLGGVPVGWATSAAWRAIGRGLEGDSGIGGGGGGGGGGRGDGGGGKGDIGHSPGGPVSNAAAGLRDEGDM
jgi:hypothetical protein